MSNTIANLTRAALLVLALGLGSASAATQTIEFFELPSGLVPWDASVTDCVVVGENAISGQYFEWTSDGGAVDIGGQIAGNGIGGRPAISNDARYVSGTDLNEASGLYELSRYDRNSAAWTNLGGIGAACSNEVSSGWNISGDGNHVVGLGWLGCADAHATQWSQGVGTFDLGSSVMDQSSRASAVDLDGDVVAGWQDGNGREGAVWVNGVQTVFPGTSEAQAVSDDGVWVVGIGASGTANEAWRWSEGTGIQMLGSIPTGGFLPRGFASAVNADGSLIMGFDRGFGPATSGEGWMWVEGEGIMPLEDWFAGQGLVLADDVRLSLPLGMSADGKTFCGLGRSATAFSFGWIIKITEAECYLAIGDGPGNGDFVAGSHLFQTQVGPAVEATYPVLMEDIPEFVLPTMSSPRRNIGRPDEAGLGTGTVGGLEQVPDGLQEVPEWMLDGSFAVQVLMWNPEIFPWLPAQNTVGLDVTVLPGGDVSVVPFGFDVGGMQIGYELDVNAAGQKVIRFPFLIPGF